jgi:hypothetical protein
MSERDELAKVIHGAPVRIAWNGEQKVIADAILAGGYRKPRTITTAEELDALRFGSVVVDLAGVARTKRRSDTAMPGGWTAGGRSPISSAELADGKEMIVAWEAGR